MTGWLPDALFLIGPKGSGKSFIGRTLESALGFPFLRVEPIWIAVGERLGDRASPMYVEQGKAAVLAAARELAAQHPAFSLETTGAMDGTEAFIQAFAAFARPRRIRVRAGREACRRRVRERDRTDHIDVSDRLVDAVWERNAALTMDYELEIDNDPFVDPAAAVDAVRRLLDRA